MGLSARRSWAARLTSARVPGGIEAQMRGVQSRPLVCRWMRSSLGMDAGFIVCSQRRKKGLPKGSPLPVM